MSSCRQRHKYKPKQSSSAHGCILLTSLPYIMRWCVVMSALKTTIQLLLAVRSSSVSARWGILTFSSLVQWIRSGRHKTQHSGHEEKTAVNNENRGRSVKVRVKLLTPFPYCKSLQPRANIIIYNLREFTG